MIPSPTKLRRDVAAIVIAAMSAALALPLGAQAPLLPRALGSGGAQVALARGHEALYVNPANLALDDTPAWSLGLPSLGLGGLSWGPDIGDLWKAGRHKRTPGPASERVLDAIPPGGMGLQFNALVPVLTLQMGHGAVGASFVATTQQLLARDAVELMLVGRDPGRTDYEFGNTTGARTSWIDVAAGYAVGNELFSLGVTGHALFGDEMTRSRLYDARYDDQGALEADYIEAFTRGGRGFTVDLGMAVHPSRAVTLSIVAQNAIGRIRWNAVRQVRSATLTAKDFALDLVDIADRLRTSERDLVDGDDPRALELADQLTHEQRLPRLVQIGVAYALPTRTQIAFGYSDDLSPNSVSAWKRSFSAGIEQKIPLLTLRVGGATDVTRRTSMLGAGFSLGMLDVGVARTGGLLYSTRHSGWIGAVGVSVRAPKPQLVMLAR